MSVNIRPENSGDYAGISAVNRLAFGRDSEAALVVALRSAGHVQLSLVAQGDDNDLVGHILFSRLTIQAGGEQIEALALAPLAVHPAFQRKGIGTRLVEEGLLKCRER